MMLLYEGLIIKILHIHNVAKPRNEEIIRQDKFNIINKNLLRRFMHYIINKIYIRLLKRIDSP